MMKQTFKIVFMLLVLTGFSVMPVLAQQKADSLSFEQVMTQVIQSHPSVKEAQETLNGATAKIELAKSAYLPTVDLNASYTRLGPVSKVAFPGLGTFQFNPYDNYTAGVNVNQTIYDFGKTAKAVDVENKKKQLNVITIDQIKQSLSLLVTNNYYTLVYLQSAIDIKNEELRNLQSHLESIEKKNITGSATKYEILTTQVKLSSIESQKYDLEAALRTQLAVLNTLLGFPEDTPHRVMTVSSMEMASAEDASVAYAIEHREEMKMAKEKTELENLNFSAIKSANNPVINAFGSAGFKNGYSPDLNQMKGNFVVGVGVKVPLFDAKRTKYNLQASKSNLISSQYETEIVRRKIVNEVVGAQSDIDASKKKVTQFEMQLAHALQAFELAKTSFKNGVITNLDLLDSETAVSESRLQLLKSRLDNLISVLKLKVAVGNHIY
ncbi:TolC family protein [uncultured Bacteroides sp.]|uniref:TolC family protein n=1 Tax=uncultured Bacteroides sp. TaxID=162156 RepID=UPI002AAB7EE4|nr:TolC family protein [uncultured Bacteroides sp.]